MNPARKARKIEVKKDPMGHSLYVDGKIVGSGHSEKAIARAIRRLNQGMHVNDLFMPTMGSGSAPDSTN